MQDKRANNDFSAGHSPAKLLPNPIRVFISSTFLDLKAEREHLMQNVFPQLEETARQRGVGFSVVDLRWGITEELSSSGKTIETCLAEVERCTPFFIGILGDRYGWIPEENIDELGDQYPWLKVVSDISITEMEIRQGALNHPPGQVFACFYFRATTESSRPVERSTAHAKLQALKANISSSGHTVKEGFSSPQELGDWVKEDLEKIIRENYDKAKADDGFVATQLDLQEFQATHLRNYVQRSGPEQVLQEFIDGSADKLLLSGEPGSGKSALLSHLLQMQEQKDKNHYCQLYYSLASTNILQHAPDSLTANEHKLTLATTRKGVFWFWADQIAQQFPQLPEAVKATKHERRRFIEGMEYLEKENISTLVILDGLDQLAMNTADRGLYWLEGIRQGGVKWIISSSISAAPAYLKEHGYEH